MIIIADDLVLPASGHPNRNNPVVGWHNVVTSSGVSAASEDPDHPATNAANPSTAEFWMGEEVTAGQTFTVDLPAGSTPDYIGIAGHNFGSAAIPIIIKRDGVEIVPEIDLTDDAPLILRFYQRDISQITIEMDFGYDAPRMAAIYVGNILTIQRRIYVGHTPLTYGVVSEVTNGQSHRGDFLGKIITGEARQSNISLQNITPDWYRTYMDPFITAAREDPFFWAWRPHDYPAETSYAWVTNDPQPRNQRSNGMMQVDLQIAGII